MTLPAQLKKAVANLRRLNAELEAAREAVRVLPFSWGETPEKRKAFDRQDECAGAVMRAEAGIIRMLLQA